MELFADSECLEVERDESCFRVGVRVNGFELAFDGCDKSARADGTGCSYTDFMNYLNTIWFYSPSVPSLDEACLMPYVRHATFEKSP